MLQFSPCHSPGKERRVHAANRAPPPVVQITNLKGDDDRNGSDPDRKD